MTLDGEIVVPEGIRAEMARLARKRRSPQMYLAVHFGELFAQADAQGNDYVVLTPSGNGPTNMRSSVVIVKQSLGERQKSSQTRMKRRICWGRG